MKNKSNFKALVAKMNAIQETEQGKLKGGIKTLGISLRKEAEGDNWVLCNGNGVCSAN